MVHYAGYCPRFHPSDFEVRSRDGVGEDWPIRYADLKRHYERLELELPVAGDFWPWGDPHRYPHTPHPIAGGADAARAGARKLGIEMRVGPVGITNGAFGNRPHCIYRGYLPAGLQGQRQGIAAGDPHSRRDRARRRDPRALHGRRGGARRRDRARDRGPLPARRLRALPAGRGGGRGGLFDRDAAAAAQLDQRAVPPRPGEQQRPGRAVRDGAGRAAGGRPVPR